MALGFNRVTLIGNVGKNPEIRTTQDGIEIALFSLATTESWKDRTSGEKRERTEWHRVVVFAQPLINVIKNYVHKGSKLYIEGTINTRKWQDQGGVERQTTEVIIQSFNGTIMILDGRSHENNTYNHQSNNKDNVNDLNGNKIDDSFEIETLDDEIPFLDK